MTKEKTQTDVFGSVLAPENSCPKDTYSSTETLAKKLTYQHILQEKFKYELELSTLSELLKADDFQLKNAEDVKYFRLYAYYLCCALKQHYEQYERYLKIQHYAKLEAELLPAAIVPKLSKSKAERNFFKYLAQQAKDSFLEIVTHLSVARNWVRLLNVYRLYIVFCRISLRNLALLSRGHLKWINQLGRVTRSRTDVDQIVKNIGAPLQVFNVLSVLFFSTRLVMNLAMVLKHSFWPSEDERKGTNGWWQRMKAELDSRALILANDAAWSTINTLSNFGKYLRIAPIVGLWLTSGFLVFDMMIWSLAFSRTYRDYKKGVAYFDSDSNYLKKLSLGPEQLASKASVIASQKALHQLKWEASQRKFGWNLAAASLLLAGFTAGFLIAVPVAITVCYLVGTLAIGMYLSADDFETYHQEKRKAVWAKSKKTPNAAGHGFFRPTAPKHDPLNKFLLAYVKKTAIPLLVVATFAVCWQAALVLIGLYMAYQAVNGYLKQKPAALKSESIPVSAAA